VAIGWIDSKPVNLISTADTTEMGFVRRRIGNTKVDVEAPEAIVNYNKYMGGVDKHDRLRNSFALGKRHKYKKYYVKLMLFLIDIALTNAWIYYKMAHTEEADMDESRADFFVNIASEMVRQDIDWATKYKIVQNAFLRRSSRNRNSDESDQIDILPCGRYCYDNTDSFNAFLDSLQTNTCTPISFKSIPFEIPRKSRNCQLCNYEMRRDKWKGVVLCSQHGVRLCTESHPPRRASSPKLLQDNGEEVTDFSWTCEEEGSCWSKFHNFYADKQLFGTKKICLNDNKLGFAGVKYTSEIHQKKYAAFGVEVHVGKGRTNGMGRINKLKSMGYNTTI
jgi:hypothetical protein